MFGEPGQWSAERSEHSDGILVQPTAAAQCLRRRGRTSNIERPTFNIERQEPLANSQQPYSTSPQTPIFQESGDDNAKTRKHDAAQRKTRQRVTKTRLPPDWNATSPLAPKPGDVVFCSQPQRRQRLRKSRLARMSPPPVNKLRNAECGMRSGRRARRRIKDVRRA